jgi:hypothetical protein
MQRERPLDADPEGLLADGERLAHAGSLPLDHDPLEHLDAPPLSLDHLEVDANGVARLEPGTTAAQLFLLEILDDAMHKNGPASGPALNASEWLCNWRSRPPAAGAAVPGLAAARVNRAASYAAFASECLCALPPAAVPGRRRRAAYRN